MKKLLFAMVVSALLVFAIATTVTADNGPHGGFNGSTDACASCHRAHSAQSADGFLLVASDIYSLCTSCHDGTGAYTNVVDGYYDTSAGDPGKAAFPGGQGDAGHGLFGGGFVNARMLTDFGNAGNEGGLANDTTNLPADQNLSLNSWARRNAYDTTTTIPVSRPTTSNHDVSTAGRVGTVWGSGDINPTGTGPTWGAGTFTGATELECTSCHDPHGNAGRQGGLAAGAPYPSYRLLRFTPEGSNGFEVTNASRPNTVGAGTTYTWNTSVVPEVTGVLVPDTPSQYWYTPNTDYTQDGMVLAYRGRVGSGDIFIANFAGLGDYMGRYYAYERPAGAVTTAVTGTILSCVNGSGVPTNPGTACPATTGTVFDNVAAQDKLGYWCGLCHDRYVAQGGNSTRATDSGDLGYHYRHRSTGNSTSAGQYTCVSCHNAHGTVATASSALASSSSYATGSVLLKADNRAVCIRCHAGAVNFFNVTTSPGAPIVYP